MMTLEKFAREHWQAGALLALKASSANYYNFQLDKHVIPNLGSHRLCDVTRRSFSNSFSSVNTGDIPALPCMESVPR